ncbi:hypothetical protein ANO11243_053600 [Dothideomycetidae sp. 11243]|nr:hypothetical protein ANO11243_053600 [fungal sp. No.11243]
MRCNARAVEAHAGRRKTAQGESQRPASETTHASGGLVSTLPRLVMALPLQRRHALSATSAAHRTAVVVLVQSAGLLHSPAVARTQPEQRVEDEPANERANNNNNEQRRRGRDRVVEIAWRAAGSCFPLWANAVQWPDLAPNTVTVQIESRPSQPWLRLSLICRLTSQLQCDAAPCSPGSSCTSSGFHACPSSLAACSNRGPRCPSPTEWWPRDIRPPVRPSRTSHPPHPRRRRGRLTPVSSALPLQSCHHRWHHLLNFLDSPKRGFETAAQACPSVSKPPPCRRP